MLPGVATENDVRRICLSLPAVTERPSWGRPAWFHAQSLMARTWTPHRDRSPRLVLVRLDRVADDELVELLAESHRIAAGR